MAPTEQIFWEAKRKPRPLQAPRRASTVVDGSGCKVTRGFLLPSRSSSRDSSDASSYGPETPGTPVSPLRDAAPGFTRPTGSLYDAPEMATLRSNSDGSLHKPTEMGPFQRPPQLGGRSQTFHGRRTSCWPDADVEPTAGRVTSALAQGLHANPSGHLAKLRKTMRRTKSDHAGYLAMHSAATGHTNSHPEGDAKSSCAIIGSLDAEEAIASDSEDDADGHEFTMACNMVQTSVIAAQRNRPTYAQRRAMSDQRIDHHKAPLPLPPALSPSVPHVRVATVVVSTVVGYMSAEHEGEIETPIEVKSFAHGEMVPHRSLRPSRSRPLPTKGVLKKFGSRSSSEDSVKHVHTAISRGSGSVVNGRVVLDATPQAQCKSQVE